MGADRAAYAGGQAFGPTARDRVASRAGRDLVYRADRLSVADAAEGLSAVHYRARLFLRLARRRLVREDQFCVAAASARGGRPRSEPIGGGHRQPIGQDHRERRAAWWSLSSGAAKPRPGGCCQEGQRPQAAHCDRYWWSAGRCRGAPGRCPRSRWCRAGHRGDPPAVSLAAPPVRRQRLQRPQPARGARQIRKWTIEIVKRTVDATGFQLLPRRWVVERTLAWLNRNRRLAKDFESSIASAKAWVYIASV